MTVQAVNTTFVEPKNRFKSGSYTYLQFPVAAATATVMQASPVAGNIVAAWMSNGTTAMSASHNYAVAFTNVTQNVTPIATVDHGALSTPLPAAKTVYNYTPSTTAANVDVDKGDIISVTMTVEGTVTGAVVVVVIENNE